MRRNYKARYPIDIRQMARFVNALKERSGVHFTPDFNVLQFLEENIQRLFRFSIRIFDARSDAPPAYVSVKERVLYISSEIMERARLNEEFARFVLAHEMAHMHLHSDDIHYFSNQSDVLLAWAPEEEQTEWQADRFAELFLMPDNYVAQYSSADEVAEFCAVPLENAKRRLEYFELNPKSDDAICRCGHLLSLSLHANEICADCPKRKF